MVATQSSSVGSTGLISIVVGSTVSMTESTTVGETASTVMVSTIDSIVTTSLPLVIPPDSSLDVIDVPPSAMIGNNVWLVL